MKLVQYKKRFLNYDANIGILFPRPGRKAKEVIILSNNGYYNPNGNWITLNAMQRWAARKLREEPAQLSRLFAWIKEVEALKAFLLQKRLKQKAIQIML